MWQILQDTFSRNVTRGQGQGHSDLKTVCDALGPQGVSSNQIWDPYLK